jgi:hypothetical protein
MPVWTPRGRGSSRPFAHVGILYGLTKSQAASVREPHAGDLDLSPADDALSLRLHGYQPSPYQIDE